MHGHWLELHAWASCYSFNSDILVHLLLGRQLRYLSLSALVRCSPCKSISTGNPMQMVQLAMHVLTLYGLHDIDTTADACFQTPVLPWACSHRSVLTQPYAHERTLIRQRTFFYLTSQAHRSLSLSMHTWMFSSYHDRHSVLSVFLRLTCCSHCFACTWAKLRSVLCFAALAGLLVSACMSLPTGLLLFALTVFIIDLFLLLIADGVTSQSIDHI